MYLNQKYIMLISTNFFDYSALKYWHGILLNKILNLVHLENKT
jgi:hypothetical protein